MKETDVYSKNSKTISLNTIKIRNVQGHWKGLIYFSSGAKDKSVYFEARTSPKDKR